MLKFLGTVPWSTPKKDLQLETGKQYRVRFTKVETTNYINAGTGESTGGVTVSSGSLSFISDYDISTLSGRIGRNWEIFKEKWHNLVSEQHEGDQPGGGIMFTSSIGEGTDRGPKRPFADATPESIDQLVDMIGQLKTTVDASERAIDILEAIERSGVGCRNREKCSGTC